MVTLVTGATGLLGNNVVRLLLARGMEVRALVRKNSDPKPFAGLDAEVVYGDICDADSVERACRGASSVIHSAAMVHIGWTRSDEQRSVNVDATRIVAEAALRAGARMVHVSSIDAIGCGTADRPADEETDRPPKVACSYVLTKRAAEQEVLRLVDAGLDAVIVNPGTMLGPWDWKPSSGRMLLAVSRGQGLFAPRGANNYCDVRDVAVGILAAVERGVAGRRYILGGESLTYLEAWTVMARVTGARKPICRAGPLMMKIGGAFGNLRTRLTGHEGDLNSASVAMSLLPKYYSSARAAAELGYRSRGIEEAANDAWSWFQEYGYANARG